MYRLLIFETHELQYSPHCVFLRRFRFGIPKCIRLQQKKQYFVIYLECLLKVCTRPKAKGKSCEQQFRFRSICSVKYLVLFWLIKTRKRTKYLYRGGFKIYFLDCSSLVSNILAYFHFTYFYRNIKRCLFLKYFQNFSSE